MKRKIFKEAWRISKKAAIRYGGSCRDFFSFALKMAWEKIRKEINLTGKLFNFVKKGYQYILGR